MTAHTLAEERRPFIAIAAEDAIEFFLVGSNASRAWPERPTQACQLPPATRQAYRCSHPALRVQSPLSPNFPV